MGGSSWEYTGGLLGAVPLKRETPGGRGSRVFRFFGRFLAAGWCGNLGVCGGVFCRYHSRNTLCTVILTRYVDSFASRFVVKMYPFPPIIPSRIWFCLFMSGYMSCVYMPVLIRVYVVIYWLAELC